LFKVRRLAIAVTCYTGGKTLEHLDEISAGWGQLAHEIDVIIITDQADSPQFQEFVRAHRSFRVQLVQPSLIGHPYFLTWIHREVFNQLHRTNPDISHYLYLEDDILFTTENLAYWLEGREALRELGLLPGFLRFEVDAAGRRLATDVLRPEVFASLPRVDSNRSERSWVNLRSSYQGMWFMDRELFEEFLASESFGPDFGHWRIRERATQGLIFESVPAGCFTRTFLQVAETQTLDSRVLVHHLSNRYALDGGSRFARIPVEEVLDLKSGRLKADLRELFRSMNLSRPKLMNKLRARIN
jgi:hypothetical protein